DRRDAGHERPFPREPRAHAAHADLVAAIAHADGDGPARPRARRPVSTRCEHAAAAPAEHLVERAVPGGDRGAARVEIVPGPPAARSAPPGWKKAAMPRAPGSRARR